MVDVFFPESPYGRGPLFFLAHTSHAFLPYPLLPISIAFATFPHISMISLPWLAAPGRNYPGSGGGEVIFRTRYFHHWHKRRCYSADISTVSQPTVFILPWCPKPFLCIILRCPGQLPLYCCGAPSHFYL